MRPTLLKRIFSVIVFFFGLNLVLWLLNWGLTLFLNDIMLPVFDWFNDRSLTIKLILLFTGLTGLATIMMGLFNVIPAIIAWLAQNYLYISNTIVIMSWLLVVPNIIYTLYDMRDVFNSISGFWMWIEFIMVLYFVIHVNSLFIMKKAYNENNH